MYGCLNFMCETYMLTYMDHILKALYSGIYDKRHIYGYIYVFFHIRSIYDCSVWVVRQFIIFGLCVYQ